MALIDDIYNAFHEMRREHLRTKQSPLFIGDVGTDAPFELTEMPERRQAPMPKKLRIDYETLDRLCHTTDPGDVRVDFMRRTVMGLDVMAVPPGTVTGPGWEWLT